MSEFRSGSPISMLLLWKGRRVDEIPHEELIVEFHELARMYQSELDKRRSDNSGRMQEMMSKLRR